MADSFNFEDPEPYSAYHQYVSPGLAVSTQLSNILMQRKLEARQAMLDDLNRRNIESEIDYRGENAASLKAQRESQAAERKAKTDAMKRKLYSVGQPLNEESAADLNAMDPSLVNWGTAPVDPSFAKGADAMTPAPPPGIAANAEQMPVTPGQDNAGVGQAPVGNPTSAIPFRRGPDTYNGDAEQREARTEEIQRAAAAARLNSPEAEKMTPLQKWQLFRQSLPKGENPPPYELFVPKATEDKHSPNYIEWQDYVKSFVPDAKHPKALTFDEYQNADANRKARAAGAGASHVTYMGAVDGYPGYGYFMDNGNMVVRKLPVPTGPAGPVSPPSPPDASADRPTASAAPGDISLPNPNQPPPAPAIPAVGPKNTRPPANPGKAATIPPALLNQLTTSRGLATKSGNPGDIARYNQAQAAVIHEYTATQDVKDTVTDIVLGPGASDPRSTADLVKAHASVFNPTELAQFAALLALVRGQ